MIATIEKTAATLPPSERDFQVFRFVRVETNSTRAAAQTFAISQTRVRQVVSRVAEYLLAVAREGVEEDEEERAGSLSVAEQIARMQLEHLYQQAMHSWNDSQRLNGLGQTTLGQTRYLSLAARISILMSKVPMHAPPRTREEVEEEWEDDAPREREAPREGEAPAEPCAVAPPPAEDCSHGDVSSPVRALGDASVAAANGGAEATYKTLEDIKAEARLRFLRPAQAAVASDDQSPESGELRQPLTRRERRARKRELERLRKKR
jgi:hypothetical protein